MAKKQSKSSPPSRPHHVETGKIVKKDWAEKHPNKVEWVKDKPKK